MSSFPQEEYVTRGGHACPVCRHTAEPRIDLRSYQLFWCERCGCWSSNALARRAPLSFNPEAYFSNSDADRRRWREVLDRLAARGGAPQSVLDVGCGEGAFLRFVGERCPAARRIGIEIDEDRAARAREAIPAAEVRIGDALEQGRQLEGTFDLITLWDVFEHVTSPGETLSALAEHLTPGGMIFIQTIHEQSVVPTFGRLSYHLSAGRLRTLARRTHDAHHLVFFTVKGLDELAAGANLSVAERWFDRLALARMDGSLPLKMATAFVLSVENLLGGGLMVNQLLRLRS